MQTKGTTLAKVIGYVLVVLVIVAVIGLIYRFTNGFNEDFKTFYVEHDGKQILTADSELSLERGKTYRFDVKYTFDTGKSEQKDYGVKVVPHAEKDFEYTVDGTNYLYSKTGEMTSAFGLKKQGSYFEITIPEDMSLQGVLQSCHPGKTVVIPSDAEDGNSHLYTLVVSSYNESVVYNIRLQIVYAVTGVTLDPSQIIFTSAGAITNTGDQGNGGNTGDAGQSSAQSYFIGYDTLGNGSNKSISFNCQGTAKAGETVSFTIELIDLSNVYDDYQPLEITGVRLYNADTGDEIDGLTEADGTYSFVMLACNVTVMVYLMTI